MKAGASKKPAAKKTAFNSTVPKCEAEVRRDKRVAEHRQKALELGLGLAEPLPFPCPYSQCKYSASYKSNLIRHKESLKHSLEWPAEDMGALITAAIQELKERKGSSAAIKKLVAQKSGRELTEAFNSTFNKNLAKMMKAGQLISEAPAGRKGAGSFKLAPEA